MAGTAGARTIHPVLLSGGSGTRLWPVSRRGYPKQFVPLTGETTLFQQLALRVSGPGYGAPTVVTNAEFRFIVTAQLGTLGIDPGAVLIEPSARNTAPAILAAALWLARADPDALMLIAPSDHVVPDAQAFRAAVDRGIDPALSGRIVTFGIAPTRAETGYGYLELAERANGRPVPLQRFVEKPDATEAARMAASGSHLWNAGIFLVTARTILAAFRAHAPGLLAPVSRSVEAARPDLGFLRLDPEAFGRAEDISIDYAVMERADNLTVVPYHGAWSDLGGWDAIWRETGRDVDGNTLSGAATAVDCRDVLLRSEDPDVQVVGLGLRDVIAVATGDAVLVADMSRAQDVRQVVARLKAQGVPQAEAFPKDHRPWGWFESLARGDRFQVKRIVVEPGGILSLQSHHHRAEHWIVVAGTAKVTIGETARLVSENESVYIPLGEVHRMENPGKVPMVLIEVQTGAYLGEDDIVRHEDAYARA
ncbi:MAG: mannose-1-phosphate guanylyltransferase/mannose-6-phosphate isomerase [Paracoccaceae bacterium]